MVNEGRVNDRMAGVERAKVSAIYEKSAIHFGAPASII